MPCIPSYEEQQEMQAEAGLSTWSKRLEPLLRDVARYLPVIETLGVEASIVEALRELSTAPPPQNVSGIPEMQAEARRLEALVHRAEAMLCEAGTVAWVKGLGRDVSREQKALMKRHQRHREEDRAEKLAQLREELAALNKARRSEGPRIREQLDELDRREERFGEDVEEARASLKAQLDVAGETYAQRRGALEALIEKIERLSVEAICSSRTAF